jgi:trans-aconitate methyltransferase
MEASVRWDAADYHRSASAQTGWGRDVHARLDLRGDEVVLDLGCGDGRLTAELAARLPRGAAIGVDADPDMIAFARRTHARENVSYVRADVRAFDLARRADVIVSTACLHWVAEQEEVLRRCRAHLAPGGRIRFQLGGRGNCAEIFQAAEAVAAHPRWARWLSPLPMPWHFRGPEEWLPWLEQTGFRPGRVELVPKDMVHGSRAELGFWLRTTWMPVLERVPAPLRPDLVDAIVARHVAVHPLDAEGRTHTGMVRLEVEAAAR